VQSTPSLPVLDDLSYEERADLLSDTTLRSLAAALGQVPDPRSRHGRRYELPMLLTCLVAAMVCNCNSLEAVGQWCREHRALLRRLFGAGRHLTPSDSLYRKLLPRLSASHLEWALAGWVLQTRSRDDIEAVALDGKAMRGAVRDGDRAPHLLSVVTHETGETLLQVRVAAKTNEIPVAQDLLGWLLLRDRIVTADALHAHRGFAQSVLDQGAHYLLPIKENQPILYADLVEYFADSASAWEESCTRERGHGRREERVLRVTTALNAHLAIFPGVAQAAWLRRRVTDRDGTHEEITYYLTSCPRHDLPPDAFLQVVRGHWHIERGHWIRDVDFGEDRSRIRCGHAPQVLAALHNAIVTLLRRAGHSTIAAARRFFAAHPHRAFTLIRRRSPLRR
jgi:predicted transposase YbfD/YdcC